MSKKKIKQTDNRSIPRIGCAQMFIKNSKYLWVCSQSGAVIISLPMLKTTAKDYETKSAKRLVETQEALNGHRH